jgi:uncharacterized membrane protein (DUF485 family)
MAMVNGGHMPDLFNQFMQRVTRCPFACSLKILFLLLFAIELYIAIFHQPLMSYHLYSEVLSVTGLVAILALATNRNCRLRLNDED